MRSLLGLKPRDNVTFTIGESGEVHLDAAPFNLESAYGSVKPTSDGEDFKDISRNAKDAKAEQTARELHEASGIGHEGHPAVPDR